MCGHEATSQSENARSGRSPDRAGEERRQARWRSLAVFTFARGASWRLGRADELAQLTRSERITKTAYASPAKTAMKTANRDLALFDFIPPALPLRRSLYS